MDVGSRAMQEQLPRIARIIPSAKQIPLVDVSASFTNIKQLKYPFYLSYLH
jgi:hypothetical protein